MTTVPATIVAMVVLSLAGLLPVLALVGLRVISLPLLPLAGAVVAALAATCYMAFGLSFIGWFVALAIAAALAVLAVWFRQPDGRPWRQRAAQVPHRDPWLRPIGIIGVVVIIGVCIWCLRGLATPTVGFDARAVWLMRAGWLLSSHQQLLIDMRLHGLLLGQTSYPPLVSAVTAVAWHVTGNQTDRLGVVVLALLNTCALAVAASALVAVGRQFSYGLTSTQPGTAGAIEGVGAPAAGTRQLGPLVVSIAAAVLMIFVAFGTTEPFMTNGYADPIWSLAAVGVVAYGLQLAHRGTNQGVALILVLVAGMSKDEGVATAVVLIVLVTVRAWFAMSAEEGDHRRWRPVFVGAAAVAAIAAWPVVTRIVHARQETTSQSPLHAMPGRARAAFDGFSPYLHVLVLAIPLAIVGGLVLSGLRRRGGLANDWWAWGALAGGLGVVGAAYVTGTVSVQQWLVGTVDRVSEFPVMTAWWIVAVWAIVASGAWPGTLRADQPMFADQAELQRAEPSRRSVTAMAE